MIHWYAFFWYDVPQVVDYIMIEWTLADLGIQLMFFEYLRHQSHMLFVFLSWLGIDKDFTQEYNYKLIQILPKNSIH